MEEFGIKKKILLLSFEVICVEDEGRIMLTYFFYITSNIWIRMRNHLQFKFKISREWNSRL